MTLKHQLVNVAIFLVLWFIFEHLLKYVNKKKILFDRKFIPFRNKLFFWKLKFSNLSNKIPIRINKRVVVISLVIAIIGFVIKYYKVFFMGGLIIASAIPMDQYSSFHPPERGWIMKDNILKNDGWENNYNDFEIYLYGLNYKLLTHENSVSKRYNNLNWGGYEDIKFSISVLSSSAYIEILSEGEVVFSSIFYEGVRTVDITKEARIHQLYISHSIEIVVSKNAHIDFLGFKSSRAFYYNILNNKEYEYKLNSIGSTGVELQPTIKSNGYSYPHSHDDLYYNMYDLWASDFQLSYRSLIGYIPSISYYMDRGVSIRNQGFITDEIDLPNYGLLNLGISASVLIQGESNLIQSASPVELEIYWENNGKSELVGKEYISYEEINEINLDISQFKGKSGKIVVKPTLKDVQMDTNYNRIRNIYLHIIEFSINQQNPGSSVNNEEPIPASHFVSSENILTSEIAGKVWLRDIGSSVTYHYSGNKNINRIIVGIESTAEDGSIYDLKLSVVRKNNETFLGLQRLHYKYPYYSGSLYFYLDPQHQNLMSTDSLLKLEYVGTNATKSSLTLSFIVSGGPKDSFDQIYAAASPYFQNANTQIRYDDKADGYVLWAENVPPPSKTGIVSSFENIIYGGSFEEGGYWYNLVRDSTQSTQGDYSARINSFSEEIKTENAIISTYEYSDFVDLRFDVYTTVSIRNSMGEEVYDFDWTEYSGFQAYIGSELVWEMSPDSITNSWVTISIPISEQSQLEGKLIFAVRAEGVKEYRQDDLYEYSVDLNMWVDNIIMLSSEFEFKNSNVATGQNIIATYDLSTFISGQHVIDFTARAVNCELLTCATDSERRIFLGFRLLGSDEQVPFSIFDIIHIVGSEYQTYRSSVFVSTLSSEPVELAIIAENHIEGIYIGNIQLVDDQIGSQALGSQYLTNYNSRGDLGTYTDFRGEIDEFSSNFIGDEESFPVYSNFKSIYNSYGDGIAVADFNENSILKLPDSWTAGLPDILFSLDFELDYTNYGLNMEIEDDFGKITLIDSLAADERILLKSSFIGDSKEIIRFVTIPGINLVGHHKLTIIQSNNFQLYIDDLLLINRETDKRLSRAPVITLLKTDTILHSVMIKTLTSDLNIDWKSTGKPLLSDNYLLVRSSQSITMNNTGDHQEEDIFYSRIRIDNFIDQNVIANDNDDWKIQFSSQIVDSSRHAVITGYLGSQKKIMHEFPMDEINLSGSYNIEFAQNHTHVWMKVWRAEQIIPGDGAGSVYFKKTRSEYITISPKYTTSKSILSLDSTSYGYQLNNDTSSIIGAGYKFASYIFRVDDQPEYISIDLRSLYSESMVTVHMNSHSVSDQLSFDKDGDILKLKMSQVPLNQFFSISISSTSIIELQSISLVSDKNIESWLILGQSSDESPIGLNLDGSENFEYKNTQSFQKPLVDNFNTDDGNFMKEEFFVERYPGSLPEKHKLEVIDGALTSIRESADGWLYDEYGLSPISFWYLFPEKDDFYLSTDILIDETNDVKTYGKATIDILDTAGNIVLSIGYMDFSNTDHGKLLLQWLDEAGNYQYITTGSFENDIINVSITKSGTRVSFFGEISNQSVDRDMAMWWSDVAMIRLSVQWRFDDIHKDRKIKFDNFYLSYNQIHGGFISNTPEYDDSGYFTISGNGVYKDNFLSKTSLKIHDLSGWGRGIDPSAELYDGYQKYPEYDEIYSESGYTHGDKFISNSDLMSLNYRLKSNSDSSMWLLLDVIDTSIDDDRPKYFDDTIWIQIWLNNDYSMDFRNDLKLPHWYSFLQWHKQTDVLSDEQYGHLEFSVDKQPVVNEFESITLSLPNIVQYYNEGSGKFFSYKAIRGIFFSTGGAKIDVQPIFYDSYDAGRLPVESLSGTQSGQSDMIWKKVNSNEEGVLTISDYSSSFDTKSTYDTIIHTYLYADQASLAYLTIKTNAIIIPIMHVIETPIISGAEDEYLTLNLHPGRNELSFRVIFPSNALSNWWVQASLMADNDVVISSDDNYQSEEIFVSPVFSPVDNDLQIVKIGDQQEWRVNNYVYAGISNHSPDIGEGVYYFKNAMQILPQNEERVQSVISTEGYSTDTLEFKHYDSGNSSGWGMSEYDLFNSDIGIPIEYHTIRGEWEKERCIGDVNIEEIICKAMSSNVGYTELNYGSQAIVIFQLYFANDLDRDLILKVSLNAYERINLPLNTVFGRKTISTVEALAYDNSIHRPYNDYGSVSNSWKHEMSPWIDNSMSITLKKDDLATKAGFHRFGLLLNKISDNSLDVAVTLNHRNDLMRVINQASEQELSNSLIGSKTAISFRQDGTQGWTSKGSAIEGGMFDFHDASPGRDITGRYFWFDGSGVVHHTTQILSGISNWNSETLQGLANTVIVTDMYTQHEVSSLVQVGLGSTLEPNGNVNYEGITMDSLDKFSEKAKLGLRNPSLSNQGIDLRIDGRFFDNLYPTVMRKSHDISQFELDSISGTTSPELYVSYGSSQFSKYSNFSILNILAESDMIFVYDDREQILSLNSTSLTILIQDGYFYLSDIKSTKISSLSVNLNAYQRLSLLDTGTLELLTKMPDRTIRTRINVFTSQISIEDSSVFESLIDAPSGQFLLADVSESGISRLTQTDSFLETWFGWFEAAKNMIKGAVSTIIEAVIQASQFIMDKVQQTKEFIINSAKQAQEIIQTKIIDPVVKLANKVLAGAMNMANMFINALQTVIVNFGTFFETLWDAVAAQTIEWSNTIGEFIERGSEFINDAFHNALASVTILIQYIGDAIANFASMFKGGFGELFRKLKLTMEGLYDKSTSNVEGLSDPVYTDSALNTNNLNLQSSILNKFYEENQAWDEEVSYAYPGIEGGDNAGRNARVFLMRLLLLMFHSFFMGTGIGMYDLAESPIHSNVTTASGAYQQLEHEGYVIHVDAIFDDLYEDNEERVDISVNRSGSDSRKSYSAMIYKLLVSAIPFAQNFTQFKDDNGEYVNPSFVKDPYNGMNEFANGRHWMLLVDDTKWSADQGWDLDYYIPVFPSIGNMGPSFGFLSLSEFALMMGLEVIVGFIPLKGLFDDLRDSFLEREPLFRYLARAMVPLSLEECFEGSVMGAVGFVGTIISKTTHGIIDKLKGVLKIGRKTDNLAKTAQKGSRLRRIVSTSSDLSKGLRKLSDFLSIRKNPKLLSMAEKIKGIFRSEAVENGGEALDIMGTNIRIMSVKDIAVDIVKKVSGWTIRKIVGLIARIVESALFPWRAIINLAVLGKSALKAGWWMISGIFKIFNRLDLAVGEWITKKAMGLSEIDFQILRETNTIGENYYKLTAYANRGIAHGWNSLENTDLSWRHPIKSLFSLLATGSRKFLNVLFENKDFDRWITGEMHKVSKSLDAATRNEQAIREGIDETTGEICTNSASILNLNSGISVDVACLSGSGIELSGLDILDLVRRKGVESGLSPNMLSQKVKMGNFNIHPNSYDSRGVEYAEMSVFKRGNGEFLTETIESAMSKSMLNLGVHAHFTKQGSSLSIAEQSKKWGEIEIGKFVDIAGNKRKMTIAEYLGFNSNVVKNGQTTNPYLKSMYTTLLAIVDSNKIGNNKANALLEVADGNFKAILKDKATFGNLAEGFQETMYKIMGRNVGNMMLDLGPSRGDDVWYLVIAEWMRFDPEFNYRMIIVGDDLENGTDKIVYIRRSIDPDNEDRILSSMMANIEYKSWDGNYKLLFGGNDITKNPFMGNMASNKLSMAGLPGSIADYPNLAVMAKDGSQLYVPDWIYSALDKKTLDKIAEANEARGRYTINNVFFQDINMDGKNILFPQIEGFGISYLDRLGRDWKKFNIGDSFEVTESSITRTILTNVDDSAVLTGDGIPHNNLLNGLALDDGSWFAEVSRSGNVLEYNPKYVLFQNGNPVMNADGTPRFTIEGASIFKNAETILAARTYNIQKAQINEMARRGVSFRFDNPEALGTELFDLVNSGDRDTILEAIADGKIDAQTVFELNPDGSIKYIGNKPVLNTDNGVQMDMVLPPSTSGSKFINVRVSGGTFWAQRPSNVYDEAGQLIDKMDGFMGITIDDLPKLKDGSIDLPSGWTDTDVGKFLQENSFDLWEMDAIIERLGITEYLTPSDSQWLKLIEEYNTMKSIFSMNYDHATYLQYIKDFRRQNSQQLWDTMPIQLQNVLRADLNSLLTENPGQGLLSSFSVAFSEGGSPVQEFVREVLVIAGRAFNNDLPRSNNNAIYEQVEDFRLPASYDNIMRDMDNVRIHGISEAGDNNIIRSLQQQNRELLAKHAGDKINRISGSPAISAAHPSGRIRTSTWGGNAADKIVKVARKDIPVGGPGIISATPEQAALVQEKMVELMKTNKQFAEIDELLMGTELQYSTFGRYSGDSIGGSYIINGDGTLLRFRAGQSSKEKFIQSLKKYFYIEEGTSKYPASSSTRFLDSSGGVNSGYMSVFDADPDLWDDFMSSNLPSGIKIRMSSEFRNNADGAINMESILFPGSAINGLDMSLITSMNSLGGETNAGAILYAIASRTEILAGNQRPFTSMTDAAFLANRNKWKKTVAYIDEGSDGNKVYVTFGDIHELQRSGNLPTDIKVKVKGLDEKYDDILDYMAWNYWFDENYLKELFKTTLTRGSQDVFLITDGVKSSHTRPFNKANVSPNMYLDDNDANKISQELLDMIGFEGKPSALLRAGTAVVDHAMWSVAVAFRTIGATWEQVKKVLESMARY